MSVSLDSPAFVSEKVVEENSPTSVAGKSSKSHPGNKILYLPKSKNKARGKRVWVKKCKF